MTTMENPTAGVPQWTLGDRLAKSRRQAGISQVKMAHHLMRDPNTLSNWENDHTRPKGRVLERWAELTGVPLWWLTGEKPPRGWRTTPSTKWLTTPRSAPASPPQVATGHRQAA